MDSILNQIIANKYKEVEKKKVKRNFLGAIINPKVGDISIIAEIKLASPSQGVLRDVTNIEKKVKDYERGGADAISVVVDKKYFGGDLEFIKRIKRTVSLPILAKDFIVDPYQVYEAKVYGADAVLLIAKIVTFDKLVQLVKLAREMNIEPVVEVQNTQELKDALKTDTRIIAVNARDLSTFKVDIDRACKLIKLIPRKYIVLGFSGVSNQDDVEKYKAAGAKGILVGTSLMRAKNISGLIKELKDL